MQSDFEDVQNPFKHSSRKILIFVINFKILMFVIFVIKIK